LKNALRTGKEACLGRRLAAMQPERAASSLARRTLDARSNKPLLLQDYGALALIRRLLTEQGLSH